jgi:hypothetical protein
MTRVQSTALIAVMLAATSSAFADEVYLGREFTTATTGACATTPLPVAEAGDTANLLYHPAFAGSPESLSLFNDVRAFYLESSGSAGLNGTGVYRATKISAGGRLKTYAGDYKLDIRQAGTDIVKIAGTLTNAWDIKGCSFTFQAVLGLKPGS